MAKHKMTKEQQELFDSMENYVECLRASGKITQIWDKFSPDVKKSVAFLTTAIKTKAIEREERDNESNN